MFDGWLLPGREEELLAKKDMVLPTHTEEPPIHTEEPQEKRRRSPLLAGLAALCLVAAVHCTSYAGHSDEQTDNSRRLEVQEDDGEDTDIPDYDLPPVALPEHATVVEAEVDIPGPNSGEPESVSLIAQQFGPDEYADRDHMQMILEGQLGLSDIRFAPHSFKGDQEDEKEYDDIFADFCVYDMTLHRQDPTAYPAVRDVMGESRHCSEHRYSFPLREVIDAVREYDARPVTAVRSVPVSGILLHEGRSGATLISNALAVAHPESTQVISEHPAMLEALQACDKIRNKHLSEDCDNNKQQRLLQDVVLLLSRTTDASITNLYLKMQSAASPYLHQLRTTFPEAKWAFFYRDADCALAKATQRKRNACIKQRRSPSSAMLAYSTTNDIDLEAVSSHEICAMHLSTLINAAFEEHTSSSSGLLVSYDEDIIQSGGQPILDKILPYLGVQDANEDDDVKSRIMNILTLNANARGLPDEAKRWNPQDDLADVTNEVKAASSKYLKDDTLKIQRIRA